jgi:hypothetical protein
MRKFSMSDDFNPVLKVVLGAAFGAACYSAFVPLTFAAGSNILAACGHGSAYSISVAQAYKAVASWAAVIGAPLGCCSALCHSCTDSDSNNSSLAIGAGISAGVGALAASKGMEMAAAQGAAAAATGAGAIAAGAVGLVVGGIVVAGTLYCLVKGTKGCVNCFKVGASGGAQQVQARGELRAALEQARAAGAKAGAMNADQTLQALEQRMPKPGYTGPIVGQPVSQGDNKIALSQDM